MRWLSALVVMAALSVVPDVVLAQGDVDFSQIKDVARAKAEEGLALYGEQKWAEAYERFRIAEDLFHAPTLVLFMGHCQRELGHLLRARDLYQRIADDQLPEDAPEAFREAVATAAEQIQSLDARIPSLTLTVEGVAPDTARVRVDGSDVAVGQPLRLDVGTHRVVATAPDVEAIEREVDLAEGAEEAIVLRFDKMVAPPASVPPPPIAPPAQEPGSLLPALIAAGVGVAGFSVGGIAGGLVLSRVSSIKEQCDGNICPARLQVEADDAQTLATVSNVGLIVGGVGAAVAVTFVFWRPWAQSEENSGGPSVEAAVSPRGLSLRGTF